MLGSSSVSIQFQSLSLSGAVETQFFKVRVAIFEVLLSALVQSLQETRVVIRCSSITLWMLLPPAVRVNPLFLARFRAGDRRRVRDLLGV